MPIRILVADDSTTIRRVVEYAFVGRDVEVLSAGRGDEALERIRTARPAVVLADVVMPGLSGYELAEALAGHEATRSIPVLLLSGPFEPFDQARAESCGAVGWLTKPFDADRLRFEVERVLTAHPPPAGEPAERDAPPAKDASARADAPSDSEPLGPIAPSPAPPPAVEERPLGAHAPAPPPEPMPPLPGDAAFSTGAAAEKQARTAPPSEEQIASLIEDEVRRRVRELAPRIIREVAWEVVPDLLERLLREASRPQPPAPSGRGPDPEREAP